MYDFYSQKLNELLFFETIALLCDYCFLSDALEIFFVNSYQNGATSWIPGELPPRVKIVVSITRGENRTVPFHSTANNFRCLYSCTCLILDPLDSSCTEVDRFLSASSSWPQLPLASLSKVNKMHIFHYFRSGMQSNYVAHNLSRH